MLMTTSALVYREYRPRRPSTAASVIPFHGECSDLGQLVPLCAHLARHCRIVAPQGLRPCRPSESRAAAGAAGYRWYEGRDRRRPEPESFRTALWQAEQFIRDVMERRRPGEIRPLLVGYRQGAALALAAAERFPETLTGVAALCGELPEIPGERARSGDLLGLPVLLIQDPGENGIRRARARSTSNSLKAQGALVQLSDVEGIRGDPTLAGPVLAAWAEECLATTFRTDFDWQLGV